MGGVAAVTTLVTGGNGWLPSHVVRRLARAGETVASYDLMEPDDYLQAFLGADIANVVSESAASSASQSELSKSTLAAWSTPWRWPEAYRISAALSRSRRALCSAMFP